MFRVLVETRSELAPSRHTCGRNAHEDVSVLMVECLCC